MKDGYYWVRFKDCQSDKWVIAICDEKSVLIDRYSLPKSLFEIGDYIIMPDSAEKYAISKKAALIGVYNINKGYADFKQITILNQNEEYAIVKSNTEYGLSVYDHIVLDGNSVNENDFIY